MQPLRIGGVPEHFNLPWHRAIRRKQFEQTGISLEWADYPGGTGAMMQDLRNGVLDIAVALTEGVVTEIANRQSCRLLQLYVESPLVWGIHVAASSVFQKVDELEGKRYAISRMGSGSHLMAFVNAQQHGWNSRELSLVTVGNIEGARQALARKEADVFMWEKFMTKPLVDSGEFRRVGECITPWPCFALAASENALAQKTEAIPKLLQVINQATQDLMNDPEADRQIADRYHLQPEDARAWLSQTKWATDTHISKSMLEQVVNTLHAIGSIQEKLDPAKLCSDFCFFK